MKKFIKKTILFGLPIIVLYFFTLFFYSTDKGGLLRQGYLIDIGDYRSIFKKEFEQEILFSKVSNVNFNNSKNYTVLTIGDSFSEQFGYGYKNYLAQNGNISILHLDRFLSKNPIETTYGILNGNMLDKIKVDYIILQSVERHIVTRAKKINCNQIITIDSLKKQIKKYKDTLKKPDKSKFNKIFNFPSQRIIKFPLQNLLYNFDVDAFDSGVYKVKTKKGLFSYDENELLFLTKDIDNVKINNNESALRKLNDELNYLSKKLGLRGIKLIVLPSPDKFDFYYDYIIDNKKFERPLFFENFEKLPKTYFYINSKKTLSQQIEYKKDIYFYDDSHWSPWASKIIAYELEKVIHKKQ
jgi:hypothetical protein